MARSTLPILVSGVLGILLLQCRVDERIAYELPETPSELINPSADGDAGLGAYCPSNNCPDGFTSCPGTHS